MHNYLCAILELGVARLSVFSDLTYFIKDAGFSFHEYAHECTFFNSVYCNIPGIIMRGSWGVIRLMEACLPQA